MELKTTKVYVPTTEKSVFKVKCEPDSDGNSMSCGVLYKKLYTLTKEELEIVIGNAFDAGMKRYQNTPMYVSGSVDFEFEKHPNKQDYITEVIQY